MFNAADCAHSILQNPLSVTRPASDVSVFHQVSVENHSQILQIAWDVDVSINPIIANLYLHET